MSSNNPFIFPEIYLASQSPRRAQLLQQIGVPFTVVLPRDLEAAELLEAEQSKEKPLDYVQRVCLAKLNAIKQQIEQENMIDRPILCADTTVALGDEILGKPVDEDDAFRILKHLSGNKHHVYTAIAVAYNDQIKTDCVSSVVTFKAITEDEIRAYIRSGEPFGRAGAYAVQGLGATFISNLSGSYSAVMGLPVFDVAQLLRQI